MIIFLIFLINLKADDFQPSVCMDDFLAVNMEDIIKLRTANKGNLTDFEFDSITGRYDCYNNNQIPNYSSKVHGFNINSYCYVPKDYLWVKRGNHSISRCGEWLALVGPSQKQVLCMVGGYFEIKVNTYPDVPVIALRKATFQGLSPGMTNATDLISPITVSETDFDLKINHMFVI